MLEHHEDMLNHSPVKSVHALDLSALEKPSITIWSLWIKQELVGIGALKELDKDNGEIKSMRTPSKHLKKGVADKLLTHIIKGSQVRSYKKLSLETGTATAFLPAQKLYNKFGFQECKPFSNYHDDPFNLFMEKSIA